jgi:putative ABC transport system permease protein
VVHASLISGGMPLGGAMSSTNMTVAGRTVDDPEGVSIRRVTHEYHRVMRIPLRGGRLFEPGDRQGTPEVVIINETAARRYFPGEDPVGRQVRINDRDWTVVGIVGDVHQVSLETEPMSEVYVPIGQARTVWGELMIRTEGDPYAVLPHVKAASLAVLPDVPLRTITSLEELVGRRVAQRKLNMLLLGLFGLLGLVISAVGIYGVMAYVIAQRTREIGVRMALGATRGRVVGMVIRSAAMMVFLGLAIGSACAWVLREAASGFLFRLDTTDPRAYIAALVSLAIAAGIASFVPARRAASVDPMEALRAE